MMVVLGGISSYAQEGSALLRLLNSSEKAEYLADLKQVRSAVFDAVSMKKKDTLCLLPLMPDKYQVVDSLIRGVKTRDSIHYIYAGVYMIDNLRFDVHFGILYKKIGNGVYQKKFPVLKCEEYTLDLKKSKSPRKNLALIVSLISGELVLIAEDYRLGEKKWSDESMDWYQKTPVRVVRDLTM
jgi:hypothetical protein